MIQLFLDPERNRVVVVQGAETGEREHRFRHRWETWFLWSLAKAARQSGWLDLPTLQAVVRRAGQTTPLNRSHMQRLMASLEAFLAQINRSAGEPVLQLVFAPRKSGVGPWRLSAGPSVLWRCVAHPLPESVGRSADSENVFRFTKSDSSEGFFHALNQLLVADSLATNGKVDEAIEVLEPAAKADELTANARAVCRLRLSGWHRRRGRFDVASALAQQVSEDPDVTDPVLGPYARFQQRRIEYDKTAATTWPQLLAATALGPETLPAGPGSASGPAGDDRVALAEWHILRGLLLRRKLMSLGSSTENEAVLDPRHQAELQSLHLQCLSHTQNAAYLCAWLCHWDRLQAVVTNWAFHLQAVFERIPTLGITVSQVLNWHRLIMAYEAKLGAGRESAWEYIFFAQFWLDNQHHIQRGIASDDIALLVDNLNPSQKDFYEAALARQRECADERQRAIGLTQYIRFAMHHLPPREGRQIVQRLWEELSTLLDQSPGGMLRALLTQEGYARHWPEKDNFP